MVGAIACVVAARSLRGRARLTWALFAAGLAVWSLTDVAVGVGLLVGVDPAAPGPFDPSWLSFYVFMLGGVALLYGRIRPERGWQGFLDGTLVALALGLFGWRLLLAPVADQATGGTLGVAVNLLYPVFDLICVTALGWVLARHRAGVPRWLWWVAAAFGLQLTADISYLLAYLHDVAVIGGLAAVAYTGAGWLWAMAARERLRAGRRSLHAGAHSQPPAWSRAVPLVCGLAVVGLVVGGDGWVGMIAVATVLVAVLRMAYTLQVNSRLIAERDLLLVTDPLTGVYNRRFLDAELARAFCKNEQRGRPCRAGRVRPRSLQVGQRLRRACGRRTSCSWPWPWRSGASCGWATACFGRGATSSPFCSRQRRLRRPWRWRSGLGWPARRAAERVLPGAGGVSASLGVSATPIPATDPLELLQTADEALYWAKADGRGRARTYSKPERMRRGAGSAASLADRLVLQGGGRVAGRRARGMCFG